MTEDTVRWDMKQVRQDLCDISRKLLVLTGLPTHQVSVETQIELRKFITALQSHTMDLQQYDACPDCGGTAGAHTGYCVKAE